MKQKTIYLCTSWEDEDDKYAFDTEQGAIDFCSKHEEDETGDFGWTELIYYYN